MNSVTAWNHITAQNLETVSNVFDFYLLEAYLSFIFFMESYVSV